MMGVVDDAAHGSERRDGDGRAGEFFSCRRAGFGRLRQTIELAAAGPRDRAPPRVDHRHHQPRRRLRRDADMHARMLVDDPRIVVEMRVELGLLVDRARPWPA